MTVYNTSAYFNYHNLIYSYETVCIETDTRKVKYADGITAFNNIEYSGFIQINNHLEVECENVRDLHYIDTIINDNEFGIRDRTIAGNSITIQDAII